MALTLNELERELYALKGKIRDILNRVDFACDDLSALGDYEQVSGDPDGLFKMDEYRSILYKLQSVMDELEYLRRPIKITGRLRRNDQDRYEVDGMELTCGTGIEYLACDNQHWDAGTDTNSPYWKYSSIEHDGTDYYLTADKHVSLEGLTVRMRG